MLLSVALAASLCCASQADADAPAPAGPELLDHAALEARLQALARAHPERVTALELGRSRGGRALTLLRIADGALEAGRPGLLVVGNIDGGHVFSSGLALWQVERILERADSDERVREFLATTTLYVLPRAAPDAAQARFATPLAQVEATGHGCDDDRDGRQGEDGPGDVDGDGAVTWMRLPDPEGTWIADPCDARASIEADATRGQRGSFRLLVEGLDSDGDEQVGEDPPHDGRVNENFAAQWQEHHPAAGLFPTDEPEARALADFVIDHEDIALVVTYGLLDNLVKAPESVDVGARPVLRVPKPGWLEPDAKLLAELGRRRAAAGAEKCGGRGVLEGSFPLWCYEHRGLWSLAICPWDIPLDAKPAAPPEESEEQSEEAADEESAEPEAPKAKTAEEPKPSDDAKRLIWCDNEGEGARFQPWTPFEHPQLGPLEIGGWRPQARNEPPAARALELAEAELDFLLGLAPLLPRVQLVELEARELGAGLVEVRGVLENDALLPLRSASAQRTGTQRPARVNLLLPEGARLVAGRGEDLVGDLAGTGGRTRLRWLISGLAGREPGIEVVTGHAGVLHAELEVSR